MTEKPLLKRHPLALAVLAALNFVPVTHAISPNIVISQVYGGGNSAGATYKNDYVELFNRGNTSASLNGLSVQYSSATGTGLFSGNSPFVLPNVMLAPGQYFLLQLNGGATNGASLPTPDASAANPNMSGTAGKVVLVNSITGLACNGGSTACSAADLAKIIDLIGYGSANFFEGSAAAPALNVTTADFRANNGCTDTDSNSGNFATGTPAPRNAATALNPCSATTPTVNLSVSSNAGSEAGTTVITVTATASTAVTSDQSVTLGVTGTGITAGDYTLSNTTITIPTGQTAGSVTFTVVDDALVESAETATLAISNPSAGISLGATTTQDVVITDNDSAPVTPNLTINDVSQSEGNSGTSNYAFTVSLDAPAPTGGVTFDIATANDTATAGSDYVSQALTSQTIPAGSQSYTFTVVGNGDTTVENDETFLVNVTNVTGAAVTDAQGSGSITNDDAASACGTAATKISAVQGTGANTPLSGPISIEGIVVGDYQGTNTNSLRGFFVQEEDADADGNPATSEGVFVFDGTTALANVSVGDRVRVTGTPAEFFNMTQLGSVTGVEICANGQAIPTAATLTLPVPGVPNGNLTTATNAINAYYEAFEGMLVKFPTTLKVSEYFELERYGQLLLSQGGRIPTFTNVSTPSTSGYINHQIKLAKRQIILDDKNNVQNYALASGQPLFYPTDGAGGLADGLSITNRFRGGDTITNLTGVLHWSFAGQAGTDAWRIRPVDELYDYVFTAANPRKNTSPNVGGTLKVASFNVLNYFTTIDSTASTASGPCSPTADQDCRGADSAAELARQTDKAATALCGINADIFGLMEIENNNSGSLDALVAAANSIPNCGPYTSINTSSIGGDAIKVGLLYKPSTITPVGSHALLTSSVDARFIDTKNRPSLAQTFQQNATREKLTVVVNHLKSKGSACTDINPSDIDNNDGQGNCNLTRTAAAQALVDWLGGDPTSSGDPDFLLIGDMNSYAKEDPISAIEKGPDDTANTVDDYTNLVKAFGGNSAYSYVFDGQTGYLDHGIASKTLLPQVTGTADWHINADEPPSFDYNDTIKDTGESSFEAKPAALPLYQTNPFRTSDHDPVIIGLQLSGNVNIINGTSARNSLVGGAGKDRITGLGSADTLTGGLGNDEFVYTTTTDGIDAITDFTLGEDTIDLAALLLSIGYEGNNPMADGIVKFATSGSNTIVYIDADGNVGPAAQRALIVVRNISVANLNNTANFKF